MCQRYAVPNQATVEREFMPSRAWWSFTPKYNVAANQYVPAIRWHDGQSEAVMMRWGLIPSSAEGRASESPLTIEVSEVMASPVFRQPWLEGQRCILPMSGFYAWQLTDRRYRQPRPPRQHRRPHARHLATQGLSNVVARNPGCGHGNPAPV